MLDNTVYDPNTMTRVPVIRPGNSFHDVDDENMYPESDIRNSLPGPTRRSLDPRKTKLALIAIGLLVGIVILAIVLSSSGSSSTDNHASLPSPPSDLSSKCTMELTMSADGSEACQELCEPAECCDFPTNMPLSCLPGNEGRCLEYHSSCVVLTGTPASDTPTDVPAAPADLDQICTSDRLATVDGFTDCHEACHQAECCYEKNIPTCAGQAQCASYAPCLNLGATDHEHNDITNHIEDVCGPEKLKTPDGRLQCHESCSNALCCFADGGNACQHHDTSFCSQYTMCNQLHTGGQDVDANVYEIREACNFYDEDTYEHKSFCHLVCAKGSCCFSDDEECPSNVNCQDYGSCEDIYENIPTGENESDVTKEDIRSACLGTSDMDQCRELCEPASCCFDDEATTCDVSPSCMTYFDCFVLFNDQTALSSKQEIDIACGEPFNEDECTTVCQEGMCCVNSEGCHAMSSIDCTDFAACSVLLQNESTTAADVREACLGGGSVGQCEAICQDAACCFDDSTSCGIDCLTFFDCGVLYRGDA